jgi:hypothetical protein
MDTLSGSTHLEKTSGGNGFASPYDAYKGTPLWKTVEKAIVDLVKNTDIVEATRRDNIVGYICKELQSR